MVFDDALTGPEFLAKLKEEMKVSIVFLKTFGFCGFPAKVDIACDVFIAKNPNGIRFELLMRHVDQLLDMLPVQIHSLEAIIASYPYQLRKGMTFPAVKTKIHRIKVQCWSGPCFESRI